jgi:FkbM family methyltransferase
MPINVKTKANADALFSQYAPNVIELLAQWYGLQSLEFVPREDSALRHGETTVRVVPDPIMGPITLFRHRWQIEELEFAKRVIREEPVTLIDIGANMGLFSRQLLVALPSIKGLFAYEPEQMNFNCLTHNLRELGPAETIRAAICDTAGEADFFIDPTNAGNFSLSVGAMPPSGHRVVRVPTLSASAESARWLESGRRLFYKSDTEGLDQWITTLIPLDVWRQCVGGVIELWNIPKRPDLNRDAFAAILDIFPNKIFLANADVRVPETPVTTGSVIDFVSGMTQPHRDLGFWQ